MLPKPNTMTPFSAARGHPQPVLPVIRLIAGQTGRGIAQQQLVQHRSRRGHRYQQQQLVRTPPPPTNRTKLRDLMRSSPRIILTWMSFEKHAGMGSHTSTGPKHGSICWDICH
mmetsp:Transcript_776/g.1835  ORF Transcript_776/g.1835 Transcript_776/m.1835 type:complete len:113 (-) Transcript_776:14-352(-)